jgi:hypothetical protein
MKKISILSTFIFLLIVAVPSFANDSYQNNRAYEQAKRRIRQHNAKLQREYEKAMREYEIRRRANKRKIEQHDINVQREYEKAMREFNVKVRANQSVLRRVERQYPGIRLDEADTVKATSSATVTEDKSSANENSSTNGQYRRNRTAVRHHKSPRRNIRNRTAVRHHKSSRRNIRSESGVNRFDSHGQRARVNERRAMADEQRRREIRGHNANVRNENEKNKRAYEKAVKEYKRQQKEVDKHNARVRKHNKQVKQYNAAQAAQRNTQGSVGSSFRGTNARPNYQRDTGHDSNWKPYLGKNCSNCPRYMRDK